MILKKYNDRKEWLAVNKNYMSIAGSVLIAKFSASYSFCAARQESSSKSATAYSSVRYKQG